MCEKMEELVMEPRPLNMTGDWDEQVNGRAAKVEEDRRTYINWEKEQKAKRRAEKRARRCMNATAFALALITFGGVYLNFVEGFPVWIAVSVAVGGLAILAFVLGWIMGHRAHR